MLEFIWKYLLGPVIADAKNAETAVWNGVTAHTGYNIFNTITWGLIAVASLLLIRREFQERDIEITTSTAISSIPFIALGGILRFLEDAAIAPFILRPFIITPFIYFLVAALFIASIPVASRMATKASCSRDEMLKNLGYLILAPFLGLATYLMVQGANLLLVTAPLAISLTLTALYYVATRRTGYSSREYVLVAFSQFFGGAVSMVSISEFAAEITGNAYHQKQLLTQASTDIFGEPGVLILKSAIAGLAIYILEEDIEEENFKAIALVVLYSIGIATGLRVLLRLGLGI